MLSRENYVKFLFLNILFRPSLNKEVVYVCGRGSEYILLLLLSFPYIFVFHKYFSACFEQNNL